MWLGAESRHTPAGSRSERRTGSPERQKKVKDCLTDQPIINRRKDKQGQEIIEETAPTWANKIAAASMVYDRAEPTRGNPETVNNTLHITTIPAAAQEIIDRMLACRMAKVEGNVIDVQPESAANAK